jgi:hypothetical protein
MARNGGSNGHQCGKPVTAKAHHQPGENIGGEGRETPMAEKRQN